jgi:hypothetical protein
VLPWLHPNVAARCSTTGAAADGHVSERAVERFELAVAEVDCFALVGGADEHHDVPLEEVIAAGLRAILQVVQLDRRQSVARSALR